MQKFGFAFLVLAAAALGACSGSDGSTGEINAGLPRSQTTPALPPTPAPLPTTSPVPPRFEPPFPVLPQPPVGSLSCSPCKKIAFAARRDSDMDIFTINADGTNVVRLTRNESLDDDPTWSPDGRRIAFISNRDGNGDLYVMDADGSNVVRLTFLQSYMWNPDWSPDGTRIVYTVQSDGSANLWEVPSVGGTPTQLFSTPGLDSNPSWSPDGTRLVFQSDWIVGPEAYASDLFRIRSDGTGLTALTDGIINDDVNYYYPSWSPIGGKIALTIQHDFLSMEDYVNWLGIMNEDGTGLTILLTSSWQSSGPASLWTQYFYKPSWSPDGTTIVYEHFTYVGYSAGRYDVAWVKADGSAQGTIITDAYNPDWQP